jgi:hypothetical protein
VARGVRWYQDDPLHEATLAAARARRASAQVRFHHHFRSGSRLPALERLRVRLEELDGARERVLEFDGGAGVESQVVLESVELAARDAHEALAAL